MSSLATCIKKHCPPERKAEFTEILTAYQEAQLADKVDPKTARIQAVEDALVEYREERERIIAQVSAALPKRGAEDALQSAQLSSPLEMTSADVPKFKTQAEVDAFKTSLREQGYYGVYLTDK